MIFQVMLLMHSERERASMGDFELGIFIMFFTILSDFGTCNNIIT